MRDGSALFNSDDDFNSHSFQQEILAYIAHNNRLRCLNDHTDCVPRIGKQKDGRLHNVFFIHRLCSLSF